MEMRKKHTAFLILTGLYILFSFNPGYGQENQKTCIDCHNKIISGKIVHAATEDCSTCHTANGNKHPLPGTKGFDLSDKIPDLCYMCHDTKNTEKNVHPPTEEGDCILCHSPHSSPYKKLLKENPTAKLCYQCHDSEIPKTNIIHKPVQEGKCTQCHDPHQSNNNSFLIEKKPQLCFKCHEKQSKESKMSNIHPPFDDDCSNCHNSHNSPYKNLLTENTPTLCFNCHEGQDQIANSESVHKVITDRKNCSNCHSPHASNNDKFLIKQNTNLCYSCHNKTIKEKNTTLENIYLKVKNGKSIHAPIELDGCESCHNPHYSKYSFLLNYNFPDNNYVEASVENFALCFECHDSDLLTEENTNSATNFRNGNKNMHFLHINGKKGRNCNLCHDMHASENEHLIKSKVKFGSWEMNLNYKPINKGGSCFPGCHGEKKYIRN